MIGPALVVLLAGGVSVIMTNTQTLDTILNSMEQLVQGASAGVFAFVTIVVNIPLALLIPSSSGHAALAMPLLAPLADFAGVSRSTTITAWMIGPRADPDVVADQRRRRRRPGHRQGRLRQVPAVRLAAARWRMFVVSAAVIAIAARCARADATGADEPDAAITLLTLAVVVVLFVWNRLPVEIVAVGSALVLYATGVLTLPEALGRVRRPGGDPDRRAVRGQRGPRRHAGSRPGSARRRGRSRRRPAGGCCCWLMLLAAGLTALIGLNGTVAALLPMVVVDRPASGASRRRGC